MKKVLLLPLILLLAQGCQTNPLGHPTKPLAIEKLDQKFPEGVKVLVLSNRSKNLAVGEGTTLGDSHGEIFIDRSPIAILNERIAQYAQRNPEKYKALKKAVILRFSSNYINEIVIWGVKSGVEIEFTKKDETTIKVSSEKECKSTTFRISKNMEKTLFEALIDCMDQLDAKL